jgi:hypothetical protein
VFPHVVAMHYPLDEIMQHQGILSLTVYTTVEIQREIISFVCSSSGPLSLVITIEELLERKSSGSGLENREYGLRDASC